MKPYISVIITAYNRKDFIKEAVQSVLNQTLDKNLYEIIVIKNFKTHLDQKWRREGVKLIYKSEGSIGEFLTYGILHSKGSIIAFLDDDDTFTKDKIKIIYGVFSEDPNLFYYHNNSKVIYGKNSNITNMFIPNIKKRLFVNADNQGSIYKFILLSGYFTLSSVAIKKDLALSSIKYLKKIASNQDDFFAYAAIGFRNKIMCDNLILTNYRIHRKNTSISTHNNSYKLGYKNYIKMSYVFRKLLYTYRSKSGLKALYSKSMRNKMNDSILNCKTIRISDIYNYIKVYSLPFLVYCKKLDLFLLLIILYLIDKRTAQKILMKKQGIRYV